MNIKRCSLAIIAGFVFTFAFEFIYHGHFLKPIYDATADLWRSEAEIENLKHICLIVKLLTIGTLAYIFTRNYEGKGIGEGIRFGIMFGILLGISQFGMYAYMPIPLNLALAWFGGALIEMIGIGIIFSLLYKK